MTGSTDDGDGNTLTETRPGSVSVATSYDGHGRLLSYARTGDPAQANDYNGLDDRVAVTSGSTTRAYVFDADGRMLGEYDSSAADPVVETIWLSPEVANDNAPFGGNDGTGGYAPLAIAGGSGTNASLYWVHGNHLGVPLLTTNASGATATPTGYTAVGFPGQTRTLADIYYNRYRDYDTTTGRYIQADPIGLGGDANPFLYANGNPLRWTDPDGLQSGKVTCGPLVYYWYNALKNAACHGNTGPRTCTMEMSIIELADKYKRFNACKIAREDVISQCFGGEEDPGHIKAIDDLITGRERCLTNIFEKSKKICRPQAR